MDPALSLYPPIQRAAANQRALLIVYQQHTVRPAAFKPPCRCMLTTHQRRSPAQAHQYFPHHNSSRTPERMDPIRRRESVRRSLFGPVDHDQLRRDLKQRLREICEQDSRRWNFNFQTEAPLAGRFQWEEVPTHCAAAFYQESAQLQEAVCPPSPEGEDRLSAPQGSTDQENCSSISNTRKCPAEVTPVRRKRTHPKPAAKPRHGARITDFFAKRKRQTDTKSILSPLHSSSSEAAQCKTIR